MSAGRAPQRFEQRSYLTLEQARENLLRLLLTHDGARQEEALRAEGGRWRDLAPEDQQALHRMVESWRNLTPEEQEAVASRVRWVPDRAEGDGDWSEAQEEAAREEAELWFHLTPAQREQLAWINRQLDAEMMAGVDAATSDEAIQAFDEIMADPARIEEAAIAAARNGRPARLLALVQAGHKSAAIAACLAELLQPKPKRGRGKPRQSKEIRRAKFHSPEKLCAAVDVQRIKKLWKDAGYRFTAADARFYAALRWGVNLESLSIYLDRRREKRLDVDDA